jgi:mycofactocin precursor
MAEQVVAGRTPGGAGTPTAAGDDDHGAVDEVDELLVEEVSIDGMCGVY